MSFVDTLSLNAAEVPNTWANMYFNSITVAGASGTTGGMPLYASATVDLGYTGCIGVSGPGSTFHLFRQGLLATVVAPNTTPILAGATGTFSTVTPMPKIFRPLLTQIGNPVVVYGTGTAGHYVQGSALIDGDGFIEFFPDLDSLAVWDGGVDFAATTTIPFSYYLGE